MLQKSLHSYLKRKPEFKFIGETFNSESCKQFRTKINERLNDSKDTFILNGDYSAATDYLKIEVVRIIGQMIVDKLQDVDHYNEINDVLSELVKTELL